MNRLATTFNHLITALQIIINIVISLHSYPWINSQSLVQSRTVQKLNP